MPQPITTVASINNYGTMRGFTVHLQAVPRYVSGSNFVQVNISNGGTLQSSFSGSGVHLNTEHPTQPIRGISSMGPTSVVITPNATTWPVSTNVRTNLFNDGQVFNPQEDDAPTAPAAPLALPKLSTNQVVSTKFSFTSTSHHLQFPERPAEEPQQRPGGPRTERCSNAWHYRKEAAQSSRQRSILLTAIPERTLIHPWRAR